MADKSPGAVCFLGYAHLEGKVVLSQHSQPKTWESLWLDWLRSQAQPWADHCGQGTEHTDGVDFFGTTWILRWDFGDWWKEEVDSGCWESFKECSLRHSSLYILFLLSSEGGIYLLHITLDAQALGLTLGNPVMNYFSCLHCLSQVCLLDQLALIWCEDTHSLLDYNEFCGQTRVLWAGWHKYHTKWSRTS